MRCLSRRLFAALLSSTLLAVVLTSAQAADTGVAYQQVENWAQLPADTKWGGMSAAAFDSHGTLYVLQRTPTSKVLAFDSAGKLLRSWGDGALPNGHGLRIDAHDNIWITDRNLHQVLKFSPTGEPLLALGQKGVKGDNTSTDALNGPSDVAFAPNGDIFVSDGESTNTRIVKFSAAGKLIKMWGTKGTGPGQLDVPHAIAIDSKGRLYVADRTNKRIQLFDQEGGYLGVMTNAGTPYGLCITKDDLLYVVDGTDKVDDCHVFDLKAGQKEVAHFGGLSGPHMLAVDAKGAIYIAETKGADVRKYVRK
jgi:DNA-binding beta-propeller fold protein YncE